MRSTLLWLRLWRALNPARRRWVPRSLWWQLRPDIPLVAGHTGDVDGAVAFRFRNGDTVGLNTDSDWKAAESVDISWATTELDTTRRVRIEVEEWKGVAETFTPEWQYSKNSGTWTNITTTSSNIKAVASAQYNEGDATSTSLITGNSKTHVNGEGTEDGASSSQTLNNQSSEYELAYQIVSTDVAATDTIDLRVRPNGASAETYTDPARITITAPPATTAQAAFRIRNSDTETLDAAFDAGDPAENANATLNLEVPFRIRFQIEETNGGTFSATGLELEYRIDTTGTGSSYGAWTLVPGNTQNWESASSFGQVEGLESQQFVQGANCGTSRLTTSAETFKANEGEGRSYTPDAHQAVTLTNQYLEAEWCLVVHKLYADGSNNTPDGSLIQFRVREDDATALDGYDNTPTITINDPAGLIGGTTPEAPDKAIGVDGFNKSGPWKDSNGNLYALVETSSGGSQNALMMLKSTDGGDTWNTQDVANNPTQGDAEAISVELNEAGDTLLINHYSSNLDLHEFRMSNHATNADTWGTTDTEIVNTVGGTEQACTLSRFGATKGTPDNDLISAFTYNTDDIGYRRRVGGSWDGTTTALWNVTSVAHHGVSSVVGSSGETHFVAVDATNGNLNGKTIDASGNMTDLLGTTVDATAAGTVIDTNVGTTTDERMNIAALIFFNDGSDKLFVAWRDATDGDLESVVVTLGTSVGSVSTTAANDTGNIAHNHGASLQPVASIARDDATGDFHAVFAAESTRGGDTNVSYDKSTDDGDNWGTDTTPTLRSPLSRINWIHASIFTHSAGNGGKKVIGFWYDDVAADEFPTALTGEDAAGEGTGFVWYDEVELISFVDGAGSANNASQTSAVGSTLKEGAASADQAVDSTSNGFADRLAASSANQAATATATTFVNRVAASSANQAATATAAGEVIAGGAAGSANNASTATATGAVFPIDWGTFNYFDGTELTPAAPGFDVGTGDYFQASELAVVYPLPITTVAGPGLVDGAASANNAVQATATAVVEKTGAASADQAVQATAVGSLIKTAAVAADNVSTASASAAVLRQATGSADQAVDATASAFAAKRASASADQAVEAAAATAVKFSAAASADNANTVAAAGQVFGLQSGAGSADNAADATAGSAVTFQAAASADSAADAAAAAVVDRPAAASAANTTAATASTFVNRPAAASANQAADATAATFVNRSAAASANNASTASGSASTAALEEGQGSANSAAEASAAAQVTRGASSSANQAVDASATAVRETIGQGSADQSVQATGETAVRFSATGSADSASDVTAQGAISGVEEGAGSANNAVDASAAGSVFAAGAATAANAVDAAAVSVRGRHGQASGDAATVAAGSGFRTALGSASADVAVEGTAAASATLAGGSSAPNAVTASAAAELVGALTGQGSANQASAASGSAAVTRSGSGSADSSTLGSADALVDIPGAGSANSASDASASGVSGAVVSAQGSASQASSASALPVVVRLGSGTSSIAVATSATGLKTLFGAAIAANAEQTVGAGFRWANGAGSADNAETASGTVFLVGDVPGEGTANMAAYATADGFSSEAITAIGGTRVYGDLDRQYDYNTRQYDNVTRSYQSPTESDSIAEGEPEFVS